MINYYKFLMIAPDASDGAVKSALEITKERLRQRGAGEKELQLLRDAEENLLDRAKREAYNRKLGITPKITEQLAKPQEPREREEKDSNESHRKFGTAALAALCLVLVAVMILYLPSKVRAPEKPLINPGVFLLSNSTGEKVAVLRAFDPDHVFPDGNETRGYEILVLETNEVEWITEKELDKAYSKGGSAPRDLTGR